MVDSEPVSFIIIEVIYFLIFLLFIWTNSPLFYWLNYGLAGIKFSIASLDSIDIVTYNKIYDVIEQPNVSNTVSMEGSFLKLLYIVHQIDLPLILLHCFLVIFFLWSVHFLLTVIFDKKTADKITLIVGFFPVGNELCLYLLRQLLSTSLVFIAMGLSLINRKKTAFTLLCCSFMFHSTSVLYLPFFIASFFDKLKSKIIVCTLIYISLLVVITNSELAFSLVSVSGEDSLYYAKYQSYSEKGEEFRTKNVGILFISMMAYFLTLISLQCKSLFRYTYNRYKINYVIFYHFNIIFTLIYLVTNTLKMFWLSSRIYFIINLLMIISCISLTIDFFDKNNKNLIISIVGLFLLFVSCNQIVSNYYVNGIFTLPF